MKSREAKIFIFLIVGTISYIIALGFVSASSEYIPIIDIEKNKTLNPIKDDGFNPVYIQLVKIRKNYTNNTTINNTDLDLSEMSNLSYWNNLT